ncbi:phage integrase Arm DNA-binding domain-containing protein [Burkholderia sp. ABCPW 14]|uniref:phage integrase Arm DNA-binding domain-containing protein n=1 Tax=Burkholderia sp. ABCPW 14 TaxID=1637860 RepID=UPI0009EBCD71|nr:phage integrase Arm DNA-binding domain-containing protein [Burkholderia sp. ABCPW 14]
MAARPRMRKHANFPDNLHQPRPGYFTWRDPRDGKTHILGRVPLAQAIHEAQEANLAITAGTTKSLAERIAYESHTVADLLEKMPVSPKEETAKSRRYLDKIIRSKVGTVECAELRTKHLAELLEATVADDKTATAKILRARLVAVCKRGMALGWMDANPATMTESVRVKVKRRRLKLEEFQAILDVAPKVADWLSNAMLLALVSGQDRSTIARWPRKCVYDGFARIHRTKTGVNVEIPVGLRLDAIGMSLQDVITRCRSTGVISKYLVHHVVVKNGTKRGDPVSLSKISVSFAEARLIAGIAGDDAPTFHEIRSLAKRLYEKQGGVDTKALLGHLSDQSAATYLDSRGLEPIRVKLGG